MLDDTYFMRIALQEAEDAYTEGEIPVGAVVVLDGRVIAKGHNLTETLHDVTAHAEMMAITAAANALGAKYLPAPYMSPWNRASCVQARLPTRR